MTRASNLWLSAQRLAILFKEIVSVFKMFVSIIPYRAPDLPEPSFPFRKPGILFSSIAHLIVLRMDFVSFAEEVSSMNHVIGKQHFAHTH